MPKEFLKETTTLTGLKRKNCLFSGLGFWDGWTGHQEPVAILLLGFTVGLNA